MRLTFVYGAVNEAYHGSGSCIRGLPWSMVQYMRLIMVNGAISGFPWFIELYMRQTMVYGAVCEAYHGLWSCI